MENDTLITSSGIIRNRSKPRVGVISANSLYDDLYQDCLDHGIDLSWLDFRDETLDRLRAENPDMDETDLDELLDSETQDACFDSHQFLLGAWVKVNGQYEIDKTGKSGSYALTYNTETNTVCVEWSELTTPCRNTSPCYVMADGSGPCGDLDSKGDEVIAYTLPADMFRSDDNS